MTCEEVRRYFEDHPRDAEVRANRGTVAEHVSTCNDCNRHVEEQRALGRSLRMVRESAPAVPVSLDAAVIARYTQYLAERKEVPFAQRDRRPLAAAAWTWSAVAAAVVAMTAFWFFASSHKVVRTQVSTTLAGQVPGAPALTASSAAPAVAVKQPTAASKNYRLRTARQRPEVPASEARSLPEGFRSLIFCDALSCPSDMDMIRVQLPASAVSREVPGFLRTSGSVTADVLVGPDGIARGIRFEEIEF